MSPRVRSGFVALEVLLASLLLVVAIVPLMDSFVTSHRISVHDQRRLLAIRRACRIEAGLRALAPAALAAAATGAEIADPEDPRVFGRELEAGLLARLAGDRGGPAVRAFRSEPSPGLVRICIVVRWADTANTAAHQVVLAALVEDPEQARRIP